MSFIFTNSEEYINYRTKNYHSCIPHEDHVTITENGARFYISESVIQKIGLTNYAVFGYDKETNRLLIEPRLCKDKGTVKISRAKQGGHCQITVFATYAGFYGKVENARYPVTFDNDLNYCIVDLNTPMEKQNNGRKKK